MKELMNILKIDTVAQNKYDELKSSDLINLPRDIDNFIAYLEDPHNKDSLDCYLNKINCYHIFNDIFQQFRVEAAVKYFQHNVLNLKMPVEKIRTAYERIAEDWVSERESAEREIEEFVYFVGLLK